MSESPAPVWISLELDQGMAEYLDLPAKLYLPIPPGSPLPDEPGFSITTLGEGLQEAIQRSQEMASQPQVLSFLSRWRRLGDLERYLDVGNMTFASQVAGDLIRENGRCAPALAGLAQIAGTEDRWEDALELYDRALEIAPNHAFTRIAGALAAAAAGDPGRASRELKALTRHPQYRALANLWRHALRHTEHGTLVAHIKAQLTRSFSTGSIEAWETAFPDNPEVLFLVALDGERTPDDALRIERLTEVLVSAPEHEPARIALAEVLRRAGKEEEALRHLEAGLNRPGVTDRSDLLAQRGLIREQMGDTERARSDFRAVFETPLSQLKPGALTAAATGMIRVGASEEAKMMVTDAAVARPGDPLPHQFLARLDEAEGETERAERRLRDALKVCGPTPTLQYALGDLLRRTDRRPESEGIFKSLAHRHPRTPWGHRGLGDLAVGSRPQEAVEHYAQALRCDPSTPIPGYDYLMGMSALREGDAHAAGRWLARAVAGEPDNPRFWCYLGAAHYYAGGIDRAIDATERARRLDPSHPGYVHNLAQYHRSRFRAKPLRGLASLWWAWRYRSIARGMQSDQGNGWEKDLWSGPPSDKEQHPIGE